MKLDDPFFNPDEWIYPARVFKYPDGSYAAHVKPKYEKLGTARCFVGSGGGRHYSSMTRCKAKLLEGNIIRLIIKGGYPSPNRLGIFILKDKFICVYYDVIYGWIYKWKTAKQKLVLEKGDYRKGEVIKGSIDFKSILDHTFTKTGKKMLNRDGKVTVSIRGVFKAVLK
ncbi:hypothetical protein GF413_00055 [Candidatus Micrarchaeota archaeon]|nr:hypothetical protein [Candidatus Micrarchaeota archaeon]